MPRKTCATVLRLFFDALDHLDTDPDAILERAGIDRAQVADPESRLAEERVDRVWSAAVDVTGDPAIGLRVGEAVKIRAINLLGYLMLSSSTIGKGLERVARYQHVLVTKPMLDLDASGDPVRLGVGKPLIDPDARAVHAEYMAGFMLHAMDFVSETDVRPRAARFEHERRAPRSDYERVLRCRVSFGAERSELLLAPEVLERASLHANPEIAQAHQDLGERLLAVRQDPTTAGQLRRALAEELEGGAPAMAATARRLGLSTRSLQRRLAEEGTCYRTVLDDLRRELAREYLERGDAPISEIAYLAGFSETSALTRAAARWFGRPPASVRRDRLRERGPDPASRKRRGSLA